MKFTMSWLKTFLDTDATLEEIVDKLTMLGLEVEEVIDRGAELSEFEVAEIIEAMPHPDADKLRVCKVKTSDGVVSIVCGAANARRGIKVVLAKIGALIPNGNFKIKQSKIRGVDSCGMLCSAEELNIKGDSSGIIELPSDAKIGDKITSYLGLDDQVIHIYVTPNRADALGVYGIARDLAAAGLGRLKCYSCGKSDCHSRNSPYHSSDLFCHSCEGRNPGNIDTENNGFLFDKSLLDSCLRRNDKNDAGNNDKSNTDFTIAVSSPEACPLFAVREIKNLDNTKESPKWLKECLENIGIGSISPLVDVTNYICYSFGQPMHAYDADKISKGLTIETLTIPEKFLALNDKEYELQTGDLVIRDTNEIHCLAGIIGGKNSACSADTNRILLEAACFDSKYISRTGRKIQINTDSRHRFERHVDKEFTLQALDYATNMILSICGGRASNVELAGTPSAPQKQIDFPVSFFAAHAGFDLDSPIMIRILENLGFGCEEAGEKISVLVPSWRYDVELKEDLVEEILRIYGYDKIPLAPLPDASIQKIISKEQKKLMDIKRLLAANGYMEVVSWSFMDSRKASIFADLIEELKLLNPISEELDYMRPSILPNLLNIASNNLSRSFRDFSLFELGPIFCDAANTLPIKSVAGIRIGNNLPKNVHMIPTKFDIFDIKADLETLLTASGLELDKCQIKHEAPGYYHPGRSGTVMLGKNIIANFGQIHPQVLKIFDIEPEVMAFELNIQALPMSKNKLGRAPEYKVSDYQMTIRDYAFIMDASQPVDEILSFIRNTDKNLIKKVSLFDVYSGDKIAPGKKSVAISVIIQDDNKTLTEKDIDHVNSIIISGIEKKFGAQLREA